MPVGAHIAALLAGCLLDLALGDPARFWHPVRWMGGAISALEPALRRLFPATPRGGRRSGAVLVAVVVGGSAVLTCALMALATIGGIPALFAFDAWVTYRMLAGRGLAQAALRVEEGLRSGDLARARQAAGQMVGRDTGRLDEAGLARAAIESVAENTTDAVVAPLFYLALLGPVGGVCHKAASTLDSMVGYRNDRYRDFGRASARLDDALAFVPARFAGVLMCGAAGLAGLDAVRAWRVFKRDRRRHASPNAGHTEAACAGALGVELGGLASYNGLRVEKPVLGAPGRAPDRFDIRSACRLMMLTGALAVIACSSALASGCAAAAHIV